MVPGLGLVALARPGLPEDLQDKLEGELALFAERMHEGLMAAALAVGLGDLVAKWRVGTIEARRG